MSRLPRVDCREWAGFDPCFDPCAMVRLSPEAQLVAPGNIGPDVYQRFRRQSVWTTWCNSAHRDGFGGRAGTETCSGEVADACGGAT